MRYSNDKKSSILPSSDMISSSESDNTKGHTKMISEIQHEFTDANDDMSVKKIDIKDKKHLSALVTFWKMLTFAVLGTLPLVLDVDSKEYKSEDWKEHFESTIYN